MARSGCTVVVWPHVWPNDAHGRADPGLSTMIRILEGTIGWFAVPCVRGGIGNL